MTDYCKKVREHLHTWFAGKFEENSFNLSMGSLELPEASMRSLCSFLGQGVALMMAHDLRYADQCVQTHGKLKGMCEELERTGLTGDGSYFSAIALGSIIEMAAASLREMPEFNGD